MREAASAAHIYGKPVAAAEAFTTCNAASVWSPPSYLKRYGDRAMALGINRFVIHTSDHQPFVDNRHKPSIMLGPCGLHYTRNNTWAEQSIAFNTYLARSSYLLQQGLYVGDIAYFYDSAGNDTFVGNTTYSYLSGTVSGNSFINVAQGFTNVYALSFVGGTDYSYNYDATVNTYVTGFIDLTPRPRN